VGYCCVNKEPHGCRDPLVTRIHGQRLENFPLARGLRVRLRFILPNAGSMRRNHPAKLNPSLLSRSFDGGWISIGADQSGPPIHVRGRVFPRRAWRALSAAASQPLRNVATIILGTGMRPGEVLMLRKENVNLELAFLRIPCGKTQFARRAIPSDTTRARQPWPTGRGNSLRLVISIAS
jgi:integrase